MARRKGYFTLVLIPHSSSKVRSFRFSKAHVGITTAACAIALGVLCLFGYSYLEMLGLMPEISYLRGVVSNQRQQINQLVLETNALDHELRELARLDRQVRDLLGAIDLVPDDVSSPCTARVASRDLVEDLPPQIMQGSAIAKDQGGGSLALGSLALGQLYDLRANVSDCEAGLLECRDGLAQLEEELRAYPSGWPVHGTLTSGFGYRRSPFGWGTEFHGGIDIAASYGTPIRATADGRVVLSAYKAGYGRTIIIDHGYGYGTVYSHNAENLVGVGDEVTRGQVIALLGNSGRTTGPHLHYEVHYMGQRVNPKPYLQKP